MTEWISVNSTRVAMAAYEPSEQTILVQFHDGAQHWYGQCSELDWAEFIAPGTSIGRYIHNVLDRHPHGAL